jgi:branched-subunit amino acid transport protein AzlD
MSGSDFWVQLGFLLFAGYLATDIWRLAGVLAASHVDETGEVFNWVRAVATALVAALIARILFFPLGALADVLPLVRYGAVAVGIIVYYLSGRSIAWGVLGGELALLGGHFFVS